MFKPARTRQFAMLAALAAPSLLLAAASAADYNYVEGGFIFRHDYGDESAGGRVAGSVNLPMTPVAIIAEYDGTDNLNQVGVGAIVHAPAAPMLDVFGGGTLEHADNYGSSVTGVGVRAGVRWQTLPGLELAPEFRYVHLYHTDQGSVRLNALLSIAPHLDLQGAMQVGDDQRYEVGMRYDF